MRNITNSISMLEKIINMSDEKPYLLRTRLERELINIIDISNQYNNLSLDIYAKTILDKIKYISDLSTQSSSGISNLFYVVKDDVYELIKKLKNIELIQI